MRQLADSVGIAFFKQKLLTAYHAQQSIRLLQDALRSTGMLPDAPAEVFAAILSHEFSRWLRKRKTLRDALVHYAASPSVEPEPSLPLEEFIGQHLVRRSRTEVDLQLDRYLAFLTAELSNGFRLASRTFWYGRVSTGVAS
jgi:hypothetical protein